jgi:hypothetical protein
MNNGYGSKHIQSNKANGIHCVTFNALGDFHQDANSAFDALDNNDVQWASHALIMLRVFLHGNRHTLWFVKEASAR